MAGGPELPVTNYSKNLRPKPLKFYGDYWLEDEDFKGKLTKKARIALEWDFISVNWQAMLSRELEPLAASFSRYWKSLYYPDEAHRTITGKNDKNEIYI